MLNIIYILSFVKHKYYTRGPNIYYNIIVINEREKKNLLQREIYGLKYIFSKKIIIQFTKGTEKYYNYIVNKNERRK